MAPSAHTLFIKSAFLAFEAQQVVALRMLRLTAGGGTAQRELRRMYLEKAEAAAELGLKAATAFATGKSAAAVANSTIRGYRTRVRKNRRRLT